MSAQPTGHAIFFEDTHHQSGSPNAPTACVRTLGHITRTPGLSLPSDARLIPALFCGQAKCMSELFEIFLAEPTCILTHWFFYVTLVLLLICLFIWLARLNAALTKYDPLFIIPLLQSNYILFSTLTGGVFFREFSQLSTAGWIFFVVGILIMFFGNILEKIPTEPVSPQDEA